VGQEHLGRHAGLRGARIQAVLVARQPASFLHLEPLEIVHLRDIKANGLIMWHKYFRAMQKNYCSSEE
jgi:hypothetical protein